ncbi:MAG: hypothetical protein ACRC46_12305 [Thermoguttaceae bacterium]
MDTDNRFSSAVCIWRGVRRVDGATDRTVGDRQGVKVPMWFVLLVLLFAMPLNAETLSLSSGGELRGRVVTDDDAPRATALNATMVKLPNGITVALDRKQVEKVAPDSSPALTEYDHAAPFTPPTAEAHWERAKWCKENGLTEQMRLHLLRVVELSPAHAEARKQLGQQLIGGVWTTREENLAAKGLVNDKRRWRYQQEIDIDLAKEDAKNTQKLWLKRIRDLRAALAVDAEAKSKLVSLTAPEAAAALGVLLGEESSSEVRRLYVLALGNIGTVQAALILATWTIDSHETSSDVRMTCIEQIAKMRDVSGPATDYLIVQLRSTDPVRINEVARLLAVLGNPAAIPALVGALRTKQTRTVNIGGGTSYNPTGGSMSSGSSQIKQDYWVENKSVRDALVALTRQNFGFDAAAWQRWIVDSQRTPLFNSRRTY